MVPQLGVAMMTGVRRQKNSGVKIRKLAKTFEDLIIWRGYKRQNSGCSVLLRAQVEETSKRLAGYSSSILASEF